MTRTRRALLGLGLLLLPRLGSAACPIPYHQELLMSDYAVDFEGNPRPAWLPGAATICFWGTESHPATPRVAMRLHIPSAIAEYIGLGYTTFPPESVNSRLITPSVYGFPDDWDQTTGSPSIPNACGAVDFGIYQMGTGTSLGSNFQRLYVTNDLVPGSFYYASSASHVELAFEKDAADLYPGIDRASAFKDFAWEPTVPDQYFTISKGATGKSEFCKTSAPAAGKVSGEEHFIIKIGSALTSNKPPVIPTTTSDIVEVCEAVIPPATDFSVQNGSIVLDIRRSSIFPEQNAVTLFFHILTGNEINSASFSNAETPASLVRDASPGVLQEDQSSTLTIEGFPRACYSLYQRTDTWTDIIAGGRYQKVVDTLYTTYHFAFKVVSENTYFSDELGTDTTRVLVDSFPFQIRYQRAVDISLSELQVFSPPDLNGDVVLETQSVSIDLNDNQAIHGRVRIRSQMAYPYRMCTASDGALCDSAPAVVFPVDLLGAFTSPPVITLLQDCADPGTVTAGSVATCEQLWDVEFFPSAFGGNYLICTLSGENYKLTGSAECHPSASGACPVQPEDDTSVTFDFTLDSANFCPSLQTSVSIDASLQAYATEARVSSTTQYGQGETAVFELAITDTLGTVVADSVEIDSVELECVTGTGTRLYHRDLGGSSGVVANFVVHNSASSDPTGNAFSDNANEAWFSFTASAAACPESTSPLVGMSLSVVGNARFSNALLAISGEGLDTVSFRGSRQFSVISIPTQAPTETQPEEKSAGSRLVRWTAAVAAVVLAAARLF